MTTKRTLTIATCEFGGETRAPVNRSTTWQLSVLATTIRLAPNKAVQLVQLIRSTKREKRLGTVILFVTSRCNSFCRTCFYHEELNRPGDMTFAQIEKVSRTNRQQSSGRRLNRVR